MMQLWRYIISKYLLSQSQTMSNIVQLINSGMKLVFFLPHTDIQHE